MSTNVIERIEDYNQGRNPERLKNKYTAIRQNPFAFFRGTCHLFYEDWPQDSQLNNAPLVWICGDLHLENFGSYKGDNRLVYFDLNDFDESILAPCTWEIARFLTSVIVGAQTLGVNSAEAMALCHCFLDAYTDALLTGKARSVEAKTSEGMVKDLLESLHKRSRKEHLNKRTKLKKGQRYFVLNDKNYAAVTEAQRTAVTTMVKSWAAKQPNPQFYKVLDVAERIAGTGSLGLARYGILVEGKGSPNENYFLDLKQARPSALKSYVTTPQPQWVNEATRVISIQQRVQSTSQAMLNAVEMDGESYILRGLQPTQDKISLELWNGKLRRLQKVLRTMGEVVAWGQLRSAGRQGSAIADQLIAFAEKSQHWQSDVLSYAQSYALKVQADYLEFCDRQ